MVTISIGALDRTYEYMRQRGFTNEFSASFYILGKKWLNLEISNPEEVVAYLDQRQAECEWHDGGWGRLFPEGQRWYMSRNVLYAYFLLDAMPALPCDEFLEPLEDWGTVLDYALYHKEPWNGYERPGQFQDVYHMLFSYCCYYKRFPWWVADDSPLWSEWLERPAAIKEWTIAGNEGWKVHRRSHIGFTYGLTHRPFPNALNMLKDAILHDGSATLNLWTLAQLICNNPELPEVPNHIISKYLKNHQSYIASLYREREVEGKVLGYFEWEKGIKNERDFWMSNTHKAAGAVMCELLPGNVDPCYNQLYTSLTKPKLSKVVAPILLSLGLILFATT